MSGELVHLTGAFTIEQKYYSIYNQPTCQAHLKIL